MARKISEIQHSIIDQFTSSIDGLSTSKTAEWRLWTYVVAVVLHSFEVIMDLFRKEMEEKANKMSAGTLRWYADRCYRFQNGHSLTYNPDTAQLYYENIDERAKIIKAAAIVEGYKRLSVRVATLNPEGKLAPLSQQELINFEGYMQAIHIAGIPVDVVSINADTIRYNVEVYYDPIVSADIVEQGIKDALEAFKLAKDFGATFFAQQCIDAIMHVNGVITVDAKKIEHKNVDSIEFSPVKVVAQLESGYFEYATDNVIKLIPIRQ